MKWIDIKDGKPPIGVPLIVTVKDHLQHKENELRYPVYYEKSKSGVGYRWSWRYGDFDYDLLPDVSEVIAYIEIPTPFGIEDIGKTVFLTREDAIKAVKGGEG